MKFEGFTAAGVRVDLGLPLQVSIHRGADAPADDLSAVFVRTGELPELMSVQVMEEGQLLFWGRVDEQSERISQSGSVHTLVARSRTAMLLDSQAIPQTYQSPPFSVVFARHAQPYGISVYRVPSGGERIGELTVKNGMSEWQVLSEFCERAWGVAPRITMEGVLEVLPKSAQEMVFAHSGAGIRYLSLEKRRKPFELIHEVLVQSPKDKAYYPVATDTKAMQDGILRRRCLSAASGVNPQGLIQCARQREWEITLVCPGWPSISPGMRARVEGWGTEQMEIWNMRQTLGDNGRFCTVVLRRAMQ